MSSAEFSRLVALSQGHTGADRSQRGHLCRVSVRRLLGRLGGHNWCFASVYFYLVIITMRFIQKFQESHAMGAFLGGIRPATVGMIFSAVVFLSESSLFNGAILSGKLISNTKEYVNVLPCLFFIVTIILAGKFKVGPIKLTILAGLIGAFVIR